jgi:hypothetical protein
VEFRRVAYDIDRTLRQMRDAGIEESVIGLAESVLRRGGGSAELPADPQTAEV